MNPPLVPPTKVRDQLLEDWLRRTGNAVTERFQFAEIVSWIRLIIDSIQVGLSFVDILENGLARHRYTLQIYGQLSLLARR